MNRQVLRAFLKPYDYRIEEAAGGQEALEKFQNQPFDLVLMDIEMPDMDGYLTTRAIRAWEVEKGRQPVPIVALTAHVHDEQILATRAAGCTAHLGKPIDSKALFETIAKCTGRPHVTLEVALFHLVPKFMEDMTASCRSIEAALAKGDLESIRTLSHKAKGSAGMFGFHELSILSASLEHAAASGDRAETERYAVLLAKHLAEVKITCRSDAP